MLRLVIALAIGWGFAVIADDAHAAKRVALVIGNSAYEHTAALANPTNDAADVSAALTRLGFDVISETNLTKTRMDDTFRRFARAMRDADAALFYYAGHGMQYQGVNYLIPIDAKLEDEADLPYEMALVDNVLADMARVKGVRIAVLDACRNNPLDVALKAKLARTRSLSPTRGFARISRTEGQLIAFATQAGTVAADGVERNSPFTAALLKHIGTPGLEAGLLFRRVASAVHQATGGKQLPELSVSLLGEFYFAGRAAGKDENAKVSALNEPAKTEDLTSRSAETLLWMGKDAFDRRKYADAIRFWRVAADKGHAHAQYSLGTIYQLGLGTPRNYEQAARWYKSAAAQDHSQAALSLGDLHSHGHGVKRDSREIFKLLGIAIKGKTDEQLNQVVDAMKTWNKQFLILLQQAFAEEAGYDGPLDGSLGPKFAKALGRVRDVEAHTPSDWGKTSQNKQLAKQLFEKGHAAYFQEKNFKKARELFTQAAEKSSVGATYLLGIMYAGGQGGEKDEAKGFELVKSAADNGHTHAMYSLGIMYQQGIGVEADNLAAFRWYDEAVSAGNTAGHYNLGYMYSGVKGIREDPERAAHHIARAIKLGDQFALTQLKSTPTWGSQSFRIEIQKILKSAGVYHGALNGEFGPTTNTALESYAGK